MTLADFQDPDYLDLLPSDLLVPHYLILCCAYYEFEESIVPDHVFDALACRLHREWGDRTWHPHAYLIDPNALRSGGSYIKHTLRTRQAAALLIGRPVFAR